MNTNDGELFFKTDSSVSHVGISRILVSLPIISYGIRIGQSIPRKPHILTICWKKELRNLSLNIF